VAVYPPPAEHKLRLGQVAKWCEDTRKEGPIGIMKRQRVKTLLRKS
jgi:hypothetical protein